VCSVLAQALPDSCATLCGQTVLSAHELSCHSRLRIHSILAGELVSCKHERHLAVYVGPSDGSCMGGNSPPAKGVQKQGRTVLQCVKSTKQSTCYVKVLWR
jgi:hypothetical protein